MMRSVADRIRAGGVVLRTGRHQSLYLALHPVPRSKQRVARTAAGSPGNLPWQDILKALETGSMKAIGAQLSAADKLAVARYLGKAGPAVASGNERILRGRREAQDRRLILEWLGRGREEHAVSAGESGRTDRRTGS